MQNPQCTFICFDYGGYYMKDEAEIKWISGDGEGEDEIHTILFRKSMEEITYSGLVERICRKIKVDESKVKVKISYFPMVLYSYKPSYIRNDDEIFGYLLQVNHEKCRSVLHVEFINEEVQFSEEDDETDDYVGLSDIEAIEGGDEDGTENDKTAVYVGISDRETIEVGDEDGNGGVLTFDEDIEMHDGVNQTRDDGLDLVIGQEFLTKEAA